MSQLNSEGIAEFIRLIAELEDHTEDMSAYEIEFLQDNKERIEEYGDRVFVTEIQLEYLRRMYERIL